MTSNPSSILWRASASQPFETTPLNRDLDVDLVIVGGGFTGTAAALEAVRRGASVCLLEAEIIGHGGSGRNVGLVNAGLWLPPGTVFGTQAATALLTGATEDLPIAPLEYYSEQFTALKSAYYELGASLAHTI